MKQLVACIFALSIPLVGVSQVPEYSKPEDGLRYREVTTNQTTVNAPQGPLTMNSNHDALVALSFENANEASASYEELAVSLEGPQGTTNPNTATLLDAAFSLEFPADGRVRTTSTPEFPDDVAAITDLSFQFFDFFLPLPDEPLALGVSWSDSSSHSDEDRHMNHRTTYRVVGDSMIMGFQVFVVASETNSTIDARESGPNPGMTSRIIQTGLETGHFYFSVESGLLVGRERQGSRNGTITFSGGPQSFEMSQASEYSSSIRLVLGR